MSSYGPPGPGQPDDPYNQQPQYGGYPPPPPTSGPGGYPPPPSSYPPPGDPYGQPGDPYGQPVSGGYPPPPPPTAQWGQPGPVGYQPPPTPPRRGGGGKIALIIGLVVLLMLALCGVGVWWLLRDTDDTDSNAQPTPTVSAPVDPSGDPSGEPSPSASPSSASPSPSSDSGTFAKGDCVVNDGTADDAELRKVPCGPNTYEVLSRIPFTTDGEKCKTDPIFGDPESDANYTHDNPIDAADYVLCLKKK